MLNSELFLTAFNKIEKYLRRITEKDKGTKFYNMVDIASRSSPMVKHFKIDLKEFADLRNAIVHERTDEHVLAEPNDRVVIEIENIFLQLTNPPKIIPTFKTDVYSLNENDFVANAVEHMYKNDFSQIPIYMNNGQMKLLTNNTISRWLGACVEDDVFSLYEIKIKDVLKYSEENENFRFMDRNRNYFEVLEQFNSFEKNGKRLEAILITHSGKKSEKLLGIITIWDLTKIYQNLNI
ncbi:MAG: CBS domain-containing protein [Candidatus Thorarchaeota archaeon]